MFNRRNKQIWKNLRLSIHFWLNYPFKMKEVSSSFMMNLIIIITAACISITRDLKGHRILFIVNADHDLTAVHPRVAGSQACQHQAGVVAVLRVSRQGHAALEGFLHLDYIVFSHQNRLLLL